MSCVAAYWDWTVVAAAVGVEDAASIAAVARDDDHNGEDTRVPPRQRFREQVTVTADQLVNLLSHERAAVREFALELAAALES